MCVFEVMQLKLQFFCLRLSAQATCATRISKIKKERLAKSTSQLGVGISVLITVPRVVSMVYAYLASRPPASKAKAVADIC